jgi:hypothetical protein
VATASRAARVQIIDLGSTVQLKVDADPTADGIFETFLATIQTVDAITVTGPNADILVGSA